jgi:hypothetical protein
VLSCRSAADMKLIVLHLQDHLTRKTNRGSMKCADCVLSFLSHSELWGHATTDHESCAGAEFRRLKVVGVPIGMAKPPTLPGMV